MPDNYGPWPPPAVHYEPFMDPALMAAQAAAEPYEPRGASPFDQAPYDDPNAFAGNQYVGRSADIPVRLEAHGEERVPIAAAPPRPPAPGRPAPARQPGLGRNPADVKAMLQENARRQYERNVGRPAAGGASMQASGQQEELDALIARLGQARMAQMADRRTARRA
jgi:hypothetical protein